MPSPKPVPSSPSTVLPVGVRMIDAGRGSRVLSCPGCRSPLNLVQPDENEPSRLLGICDSCATWSLLIELEPDWRRVLMVEIPGDESILRHLEEDQKRPAG